MPYYDTSYTNYDQIEQKIVHTLDQLNRILNATKYTNHEWTHAIIAVFSKLGHQEGNKVAATPTNLPKHRGFDQIRQDVAGEFPDKSEWLYDIIWYKPDQTKNHTIANNNFEFTDMIDIPLVVECEWKDAVEVHKDFEKLLIAKSKYRVMIFQALQIDISPQIDWCIQQINKSVQTQSGDRYLFCPWDGNSRQFKFKLFVAP